MSNKQGKSQQQHEENELANPEQTDEPSGGEASSPNRALSQGKLTNSGTNPTLLSRISVFFSTARTIVLSIGAIALVTGISWVLFSETRAPTVYIEPWGVPESLEKSGYSGSFLARGLIDNLTKIRTDANTSMEKLRISYGEKAALGDVKVSGTTISLSSIVQYLQAFLGNSNAITGDLVSLGEHMQLTVRVVGRPSKTIRGKAEELDKFLLEAAEHVTRDLEPVILANYLYEQKRIQEALETIKFALHTLPRTDDGRAYALWGWILTDANNFAGAEKKFRRASELEPEASYPYEGWGWVLGELGKLDDAVKKYQRAIDLDPNTVNALNNLSAVFIKQGKLDDVITTVKRGLMIKPDEAALYYNWGTALAEQGHYKEALEKYETGFEIHDHDLSGDPFLSRDYVGMHQLWVYSLLMVGRNNEAIDRCKWALELDPENERLNAYIGIALLEVGKREEAAKALEKAIELGAQDEAVRSALHRAKTAEMLPKDDSR